MAGVTWSAAYQLFEVAASFAAMLVLVRVVPPSEYGRAAATIGMLALLNTVSAHVLVGHALQAPGERQPDWTLYWSLAWYTQTAVFVLCHAVAAACWMQPRYRPIAPLLHVAAFGVLLEAPNQIGATMLRRDLALRRLKIIAACSVTTKLAAMIAMGLGGFGAYAIVVGGNVIAGLPFAVDLLIVRRWRPRAGWWKVPDAVTARPALLFAGQQVTGRLIASARSACEAAVLPAALGFGALGLLGRAQSLYIATFGRAATVISDSVYPILPRAKDDADRFARRATMFLQALFLLVLPGGLFVGLEGRALSRVLYGHKWVAMDPLIWPGAVIGMSAAVFAASTEVLLAAGRLRRCVSLDVAGLFLLLPALLVAIVRRAPLDYAVALAVSQLLAAAVALRAAAPLLVSDWVRQVLRPAGVAGGLALLSGFAARALLAHTTSLVEFLAGGLVFAVVTAAVIVIVFPHALVGPLDAIGRMAALTQWLRRRAASQARLAAVPAEAVAGDMPRGSRW